MSAPSRSTGRPPATLNVGTWHVDTASRSATNGSVTRRLSPRAINLLEVLAEADGQAVSRRDLLDRVWPNVIVGDESLTQVVTELRRALGDRRGPQQMIETIPRYGYRLTCAVTTGELDDAAFVIGATDGFDLEAYRLCLEANRAMCRGGVDAMRRPEELTEEAVARAPNFALANAEYAIALSYRWLYQRGDAGGLGKALTHAETACRLRPDLSAGHAALAFAQGAFGRGDRTRSALAQGLACDHTDPRLHFLGARALFAMRDYQGSAGLAEQAAVLDRDDFRPLFLAARAALVFDPARSTRNALACLDRVNARLALDPYEPRALNALGLVYSLLGRSDEAHAAIAADAATKSPCLIYSSIALAELGDNRAAVDVFEEVVDLGWHHGEWVLAEPALRPLWQNPRFRKAAGSIGLH